VAVGEGGQGLEGGVGFGRAPQGLAVGALLPGRDVLQVGVPALLSAEHPGLADGHRAQPREDGLAVGLAAQELQPGEGAGVFDAGRLCAAGCCRERRDGSLTDLRSPVEVA